MEKTPFDVMIVGAGLAGSEAAWQAAQRGVRVRLYDMRPHKLSPAHQGGQCAELVCSNSFRSDDHQNNAVGLLHEEMRRCGSLIMRAADAHQVPAGSALAVDRETFSAEVTSALEAHDNIEIVREEIVDIPQDVPVIIATGPLTSDDLSQRIAALTGAKQLAFFDAIAPIVYKDSINFDVAWMQSRYDKAGLVGEGADYINCPMDKDQYDAFIDALLGGETTPFKTWEHQAPLGDIEATPYFDACLPIEVMAARGRETLRHGPMKPVGLTNAHAPDVKPYAIVQLRQDNALGTLFNMVGFQTKLKYGAQGDIFRMIPALEEAEFARLGGIHRNSYINSPQLLDAALRLKSQPNVRFAGQISGCEGYVESASVGLMAGRFIADELGGRVPSSPPPTTALGALLGHITGGHLSDEAAVHAPTFQPMNINFGLFPDITREELDALGILCLGEKLPRGRARRGVVRPGICARALKDLETYLSL